MSKNTTRKGIALGASFALFTSLLAGVPANAAGEDGNVSLVPNAGAEYDIIAGAKFELKSNFATGVQGTGKYLKFLVEDAGLKATVDVANSSKYVVTAASYAVSNGDGTNGAPTGTRNLVTITFGSAHKFKVGDKVQVAGSTTNEVDGFVTISAVASSTTIAYERISGTGTVTTTTPTVTLVASYQPAGQTTAARGTGTSYIFDTKSDTNLADKVLRLVSTDEDTTQTVTVTAWVDDNDNGLVDATESKSPARVIRFLKHSDVTPTVTFVPITAGTDSTVVADVTFSPVLNGSQLVAAMNLNGAANAVKVDFTRPGSADVIVSASTSYSNTTKKWTATSANMNAAGWNIAQPADTSLTSITITKNVVTATVGAAHGLQVGDRVVIASATTSRANSPTSGATQYSTVLSVPTTTTFTYAELNSDSTAATGADLAATAQSAGTVDVDTDSDTKILRNFAVAGTYSGQVKLYKHGTVDALTTLGSATTYTVGSTVATTVEIAGSPTAAVNAAGKIKTGTTAADFIVAVTDEDGEAVRAGIPVAVTAQKAAGVTGTVTANGTTVGSASAASISGVTDANGEFKIALTNTGAIAGDTVTLNATVQGVAATAMTATWEDAIYSILDLNDVNSSTPSRNRAVAAGATHTFELLVHDQWKAAFTGTDLRLKVAVTGRTVATNVYALAAGKASVPVADGGLTAGAATVTVTLEKLTGSTWAALADASGNTWDGAGSGDLATVAINYTASSSITLNADAANLPSSTTADYTASVTTLATASLDGRLSNAVAPAYTAASKAVVAGGVYTSAGVLNSGATVTLSGAGLLFKSGNVWSMDSITIVTDNGTFAADVYSRTSGAKTVKVTSGAATKDATVTFTSLGTTAGYTVTLDAPASVVPGSTFKVSGTVKDVNGNPIVITTAGTGANPTLSVGYQGRGLVSGTLPTTTDASGNFFFYVLVGSTDLGEGVVTASYDADGTGTTRAAATVSKTIAIAAVEPVAKIGSFNGRVAVRVENAKGSTISVKIGRQWYKYSALNNNYLQSWRSAKGRSVAVSVYVDGELQNVQTITVK